LCDGRIAELELRSAQRFGWRKASSNVRRDRALEKIVHLGANIIIGCAAVHERANAASKLSPERHSSAFRGKQSRDCTGATLPVRGFGGKLFAAGARQRIEFCAPRIFRVSPLGVEPTGTLESLERREQRSRIDLEHTLRQLLDASRNSETMHRLETQRLENQQVERALDDVGVGLVHGSSRRVSYDDDSAVRVGLFIMIVKM
jgi:hypothetical protein